MDKILLWAGVIWGAVLTVIRFVESIYELSKTPEAKTVIEKIKQIWKNFWPLNIETYSSKK